MRSFAVEGHKAFAKKKGGDGHIASLFSSNEGFPQREEGSVWILPAIQTLIAYHEVLTDRND